MAGRRRRSSLFPTRSATTSAAISAPRPGAARGLGGEVRRVQEAVHGGSRATRSDLRRRPAAGLGRRRCRVSRRRQGLGHPRLVGKSPQPTGQADPLASGRLSRSGPLDFDPDDVRRRRRRLRAWKRRRPEFPLRHPRARHGRDLQRPGPVRPAALRLHLLRLQRRHAPLDPAGRIDGPARPVHLHPRFDRRRRGRADAPADRAPCRLAGDPQFRRPSPRRRQRNGRGVQGRPAAPRPTGGARADAAEPPHARPRSSLPPRACRRAATSWPTPPTASRR